MKIKNIIYYKTVNRAKKAEWEKYLQILELT